MYGILAPALYFIARATLSRLRLAFNKWIFILIIIYLMHDLFLRRLSFPLPLSLSLFFDQKVYCWSHAVTLIRVKKRKKKINTKSLNSSGASEREVCIIASLIDFLLHKKLKKIRNKLLLSLDVCWSTSRTRFASMDRTRDAAENEAWRKNI